MCRVQTAASGFIKIPTMKLKACMNMETGALITEYQGERRKTSAATNMEGRTRLFSKTITGDNSSITVPVVQVIF